MVLSAIRSARSTATAARAYSSLAWTSSVFILTSTCVLHYRIIEPGVHYPRLPLPPSNTPAARLMAGWLVMVRAARSAPGRLPESIQSAEGCELCLGWSDRGTAHEAASLPGAAKAPPARRVPCSTDLDPYRAAGARG